MFSIRNSATRLVGAAATVALAALSLTACGDGAGSGNEGASTGASRTASPSTGVPTAGTSTAAPSSPPTTAVPSASSVSTVSTAPDDSQPTADPVATKAPATPGKPVTCGGSNTKTVAAPLKRPVNHMLLTVTNTGSRTCYLYGYPAVRFSDAQSVPPVLEDSHPQAVVTLNPGESGYASVKLSAGDGSDSYGRTVKSLTVYFSGRSGNESVPAVAHPPLPAKGVYIDDSLNTTYWQQSMDDALMW